VRKEGVPTLILNAGNALFKREKLKPNQTLSSRLGADLIISSYNIMGCDAFSVGAYDLSLGIDYLIQKESQAKFPFISANLFHRHGRRLFAPYVMKQVGGVQVGIFGLIGDRLKRDKIPGGHKIMVEDPREVAKTIVPELKERGADLVVLLTDISGRPLRRMALLGLPIDVIVGSDKRNQISLPIVVQNTYLTHLDRGGKSVGRLDITSDSHAQVDSPPASRRERGKKIGDRTYLHNFIQLRLSLPDDPTIGPMVAAVREQISAVQKDSISQAKEEDEGGCGKEYVGAEACTECHPGRHRVWLTTGHARAYEALVKKNRQYDDECVVCHALAYECDKGSLDLKNVETFANVQCESCHGPGDLHVQSRGEQRMIVESQARLGCLRCHTPEKSSESSFLSRFKQICGGGE
jgi:hypothetical protein